MKRIVVLHAEIPDNQLKDFRFHDIHETFRPALNKMTVITDDFQRNMLKSIHARAD
jgi:hypothetical protein